jgi:hypothetical protein
MKKLLQEVKESSGSVYQLSANLEKCQHPDDYHLLVFSSIWTGAKNPELEQIKGRFLMSPEAIKNLKELLEAVE